MTTDIETIIEAGVRARVEKEVRSATRRESRPKFVPHSDEFVAARAAFAAEWEAMNTRGIEAGFLEWTDDYDGVHPTVTTGYSVIDGVEYVQTDDEWEASLAADIDRRVTGEVKKIMAAIETGFQS